MTQLRERVSEFQTLPKKTATYAVQWVAGIAGALAALVGAWLYWAPSDGGPGHPLGTTDGTLSLFAWDWDASGLSEAWPFGLMIAGGVLLCAAFGFVARRMFRIEGKATTSMLSASALSVLALAGVVAVALLWIF